METAIQKLGKVSITVEKDPHSLEKEYDRLVVVNDIISGKTYISRKPVPTNTQLTNKEYWIPMGSLDEQVILDYNAFKQAIETDILNMEIDINDYKEAISAAEALRVAAEANRVNAELTRANAEAVRSNEERTRSQAEITRQSNEEIRQQQEGTSSDNPNASGSRWARYKKAENDRQTSFTNNESERNTVFESSQQDKTEAFNSSESSRAQTFNESQSSRTTAFNEAQTNRTQDYNQAESNRDTQYASAEQNRNTQYASAEGSNAGSESGDSSRWGKYKEAEENRNAIVNSIKENVGYYVCDTAESTVNKTISSSNYTLITGGTIKIKFTHKNTATSPTLQIGSAAAKPLYYNGVAANSSNSWSDNEIVDVYYDGEYYQIRNYKSLFKEGEAIHDVSIVDNLTTGGEHNVLSAGQGKLLGDAIYGTYDFHDETITLLIDKYYLYTASSNSINVATNTFQNARCVRISVSPGDKFKIFGKSLSNASAFRLWCFSDGTNTNNTFSALSVANAYIDTRQNGVVITAPEGSVYLTINFAAYDSEQDKIQKLKRANDGLVSKFKFSSGQNLNEVSIVDSFDSDSANDALSAKQGKTIGDTLYDKFAWQDDMEDLETNHYYNTSGGSHNKIDSSSLQLNGTSCIKLSCKEGDKFKIFGKGNSGVVQLYVFTNSNSTILYKPDTAINSRASGLEITAPANSGYLYINFYEYDSNTDKVQKQVLTSEGLVTNVNKLEEDLNSAFPLNDKNIVVFGDSLSEFKYNSKGWCDYAAEISKANFINCAIGGTQFRQRRNMITLFDSSKTYNVGDWVYYKPSTTMNCYECVAEHSGAWNDDDFDEVAYNYYIYSPLDIVNIVKAVTNTDIEVYADRFVNQEAAIECVKDHNGDNNTAIMNRLKSIDWSTVGAVVCMAGANDFNEKQYGTSGSTDINKTLGAINEIVRMLNSTYKNIPIYLVTDTVRWFNYSSGSGVDANWCDVYVPSGGTLTYKEFFATIINEGKNNHIPVIDLYNELGWNKWNFSNFFTDSDGTHPYKGFRQIAEKIVSFIISNKVF